MKSPVLNGRKIRSMIPPAKFCTVPFNAIPIAIPPPASRAAREVVSIPNVPTVVMISMIVRAMLTMLWINEAIAASVSFFSKILLRIVLTFLISQTPMK